MFVLKWIYRINNNNAHEYVCWVCPAFRDNMRCTTRLVRLKAKSTVTLFRIKYSCIDAYFCFFFLLCSCGKYIEHYCTGTRYLLHTIAHNNTATADIHSKWRTNNTGDRQTTFWYRLFLCYFCCYIFRTGSEIFNDRHTVPHREWHPRQSSIASTHQK